MKKTATLVVLVGVYCLSYAAAITGTQFGQNEITVTGRSKVSALQSQTNYNGVELVSGQDVQWDTSKAVVKLQEEDNGALFLSALKFKVKRPISKIIITSQSTGTSLKDISIYSKSGILPLSYSENQREIIINNILSGSINAPQVYDLNLEFKSVNHTSKSKKIIVYFQYEE